MTLTIAEQERRYDLERSGELYVKPITRHEPMPDPDSLEFLRAFVNDEISEETLRWMEANLDAAIAAETAAAGDDDCTLPQVRVVYDEECEGTEFHAYEGERCFIFVDDDADLDCQQPELFILGYNSILVSDIARVLPGIVALMNDERVQQAIAAWEVRHAAKPETDYDKGFKAGAVATLKRLREDLGLPPVAA